MGAAKERRRVTAVWRDAVQAWLDDAGHGGRVKLAKVAGCEPGTITKLLDGSTKTSPFVEPISEFLGLTLLPEQYVTEDLLRLHRKLNAIHTSDIAVLENILDTYLGKSHKKTPH